MLLLLPSLWSHVQLFATLQTVALQAPLSLRFSRLEYWSGLPWPYSRDLLDARNELTSFMSPALAGKLFTTHTIWEALNRYIFALCLHPCSKPLALRGSHNPHSPPLRLGERGWIEILVTFQVSEANFCRVFVCVFVCVCIHVVHAYMMAWNITIKYSTNTRHVNRRA